MEVKAFCRMIADSSRKQTGLERWKKECVKKAEGTMAAYKLKGDALDTGSVGDEVVAQLKSQPDVYLKPIFEEVVAMVGSVCDQALPIYASLIQNNVPASFKWMKHFKQHGNCSLVQWVELDSQLEQDLQGIQRCLEETRDKETAVDWGQWGVAVEEEGGTLQGDSKVDSQAEGDICWDIEEEVVQSEAVECPSALTVLYLLETHTARNGLLDDAYELSAFLETALTEAADSGEDFFDVGTERCLVATARRARDTVQQVIASLTGPETLQILRLRSLPIVHSIVQEIEAARRQVFRSVEAIGKEEKRRVELQEEVRAAKAELDVLRVFVKNLGLKVETALSALFNQPVKLVGPIERL
eukprot:Platyproteum_vivax@DN8366_c0_g1_i1.p1